MPTATAERLIIKTRAELLRTIKREGLVIRVVRHWQEHLANTTRTVQKAQTNGYFFYANNRDGKRVRMWADIPKASSILFGADGEVVFYPGEDKHWTVTFEIPEPEPQDAEPPFEKSYTVHMYAVVRVPVRGIVASSQEAAIDYANQTVDLDALFQHPEYEYADDIDCYLVVEDGDDEHENTQWYDKHIRRMPSTTD
jgi:hypothetical protein